MDWERVRGYLREYGQEHLLQHLKTLSEEEQADLYADLEETDWRKLSRLWQEAKKSMSENGEMKDDRLKPLDSSIVGSTARDKDRVAKWWDKGKGVCLTPQKTHYDPPSFRSGEDLSRQGCGAAFGWGSGYATGRALPQGHVQCGSALRQDALPAAS